MVHLYNGILLRNKKEETSDIYNKDRSQTHCIDERRWTQSMPTISFHLYKIEEQAKLAYENRNDNKGYLRWQGIGEQVYELSGIMEIFYILTGMLTQVYTFSKLIKLQTYNMCILPYARFASIKKMQMQRSYMDLVFCRPHYLGLSSNVTSQRDLPWPAMAVLAGQTISGHITFIFFIVLIYIQKHILKTN